MGSGPRHAPSGRVLAVFAKSERDILRDRVKAGIDQARKDGKPPSASGSVALRLSAGYVPTHEPQHVGPNPDPKVSRPIRDRAELLGELADFLVHELQRPSIHPARVAVMGRCRSGDPVQLHPAIGPLAARPCAGSRLISSFNSLPGLK